MPSANFDVETVVLTREYLESVHGRMTFADTDDDDGDVHALLATPADDDALPLSAAVGAPLGR